MWMVCCFMCLMMVWSLAASFRPVVFQLPILVVSFLGTLVVCVNLLWGVGLRQWVLNQWALVTCVECAC